MLKFQVGVYLEELTHVIRIQIGIYGIILF